MTSAEQIGKAFQKAPFLTAGAVLIAASVAPAAWAQSGRPDTRTMSCAQVQALIKKNGAVVMTTGRYTFDRYVFTRNSCFHGQFTRNEWVPTKDVRQCLVRVCFDPDILLFE